MNQQKFVLTFYNKIESCGDGCCSWNASHIEIIDAITNMYLVDIDASHVYVNSMDDLINLVKELDPYTGYDNSVRILDHQVEYRIEDVLD